MELHLSQRNTICPAMGSASAAGIGLCGVWLPGWRRYSRAPRLRRKGPQWELAALLLLVANVALAVAVWRIVDGVIH